MVIMRILCVKDLEQCLACLMHHIIICLCFMGVSDPLGAFSYCKKLCVAKSEYCEVAGINPIQEEMRSQRFTFVCSFRVVFFPSNKSL